MRNFFFLRPRTYCKYSKASYLLNHHFLEYFTKSKNWVFSYYILFDGKYCPISPIDKAPNIESTSACITKSPSL